jgi:hypothetical protein
LFSAAAHIYPVGLGVGAAFPYQLVKGQKLANKEKEGGGFVV